MIPTLAFVTALQTSQSTLEQSTLQSRLTSLFSSREASGIDFGVIVASSSGQVLFEHNPDARLTPASNMKVLSNLYAFLTLGSTYRPSTRFWNEGTEMIVDAPGDPTITTEQLLTARDRLAMNGDYRVKVRNGFVGGYPEGWKADDYQYRYGAAVFPLTVDRGMMKVFAQNGDLLPAAPWTGVAVQRGKQKGSLSTEYNFWGRTLVVKGKLPNSMATIAEVPLPDPTQTACSLLGGGMSYVTSLPARPADHEILGPTIAELSKLCLKPSDNQIAESMMLLAAQRNFELTTSANSFSTAAQAMANQLTPMLGLPFGDVNAFDGSGLSRKNRVTARALARALQLGAASPFAYDYVTAFPRPGEGTMRSRLVGVPVAAKTGTLNGVSSLSGYVYPDRKDPIIFSVIGNTRGRSASSVRTIADKLVKELALEFFAHGPDPSNVLEEHVSHSSNGPTSRHRLR